MLIVTTSADHFGADESHKTGVWLEEFAVPFMEFLKNKIELTVASPQGGAMPIDPRINATERQTTNWAAAI